MELGAVRLSKVEVGYVGEARKTAFGNSKKRPFYDLVEPEVSESSPAAAYGIVSTDGDCSSLFGYEDLFRQNIQLAMLKSTTELLAGARFH